MRFHLTEQQCGGWKLRSWRVDHRPGAFLARLWALFGQPPTEIDDGFRYAVRDSTVLDDFEALLDETRPVDCEFRATAWDEGEARVSIGWENGRPFERTVR